MTPLRSTAAVAAASAVAALMYATAPEKDTWAPSVAVVAASTAPAAPGDIKISLHVDQPAAGALAYTARSTPDAIEIVPDDKLLMDAWRGSGRMLDRSYVDIEYDSNRHREFRSLPLTVRVANPTAVSESLVNAYVDVVESRVDYQPLFWFVYPPRCEGGKAFQPGVSFVNFGWSKPTAAKVEFAFVRRPAGMNTDVAPLLQTPERSVNLPIAAGEAPLAYDFEPDLVRLGVDTRSLHAKSKRAEAEIYSGRYDGFACGALDQAPCLEKIRSSGILGHLSPLAQLDGDLLIVPIAARLIYSWSPPVRNGQTFSAPFAIDLVLGTRTSYPCGGGGDPPDQDPAGATRVEFSLDRKAYRIALPQRVTLAAGANMQLKLQMRSAKSADHRFRIVIETATGKTIRSKEVRLLAFTPTRTPLSILEAEEPVE